MAAVVAGGGASLCRLRAKQPLTVAKSALLLFTQQRESSSKSPTDTPILQKLLKSPVSRVKEILDSDFTPDSAEFPSAALVSSLNTSAPEKANWVIEWKLEKLRNEKTNDQDCYARLISLCGSIKNLHTAMLVFTSMELQGIRPTPLVFNALITTSLSSGNLPTALSFFKIMQGSESCKPDSNTYNAFISTYANMGNKTETESWLKAKITSGFPTDAQTFGFLIHCCVKSRDLESARRYLEEMMLEGLRPHESVVREMLLMYCQQRDSCNVQEILNFVLDCGWEVDANMSKSVVDLYCELGLLEELEELLESFKKSNQVLEARSLVHASLIRMYADKDRLDDVEFCVGRMVKDGASFRSEEDVRRVICLYFRREAYEKLDMFLECIKRSYKLTRSCYDLLGAGYRRAGLSEKMELLVVEMKEASFV